MSKEKIEITTDRIEQLRAFVEQMHAELEIIHADSKRTGRGVRMDGWPTICRSLQMFLEQARKLAGPTSRLHDMDAKTLLFEGMTFSKTKRERPVAIRQAPKKIAAAKKNLEAAKKKSTKDPT